MARLRWPKSIHSQIASVFSSIRAIGVSKAQCSPGDIRSVGTMKAYVQEAHSFGRFLIRHGVTDLRNVGAVQKTATQYLSWRIENARKSGQSVRTQETRAAALGGLERAFNKFFAQRGLAERLDISAARREYLSLSRAYLEGGREYAAGTRAYPFPEKLIAAIGNETHRLQATLQLQGGLRAEGVGAPSGRIANPLTKENLKGFLKDPATGVIVGRVDVQEKGGKVTAHYISQQAYAALVSYLQTHQSLQSRYSDYRESVITAAKITGQFSSGRGTHGLKTSFAHRRYAECVRCGFSHERAMQQVALELAHNRADVTLIYTKG